MVGVLLCVVLDFVVIILNQEVCGVGVLGLIISLVTSIVVVDFVSEIFTTMSKVNRPAKLYSAPYDN